MLKIGKNRAFREAALILAKELKVTYCFEMVIKEK